MGPDPIASLVMRFVSDNAGAACPEVMEAVAAANRPDMPYDGDALSRRLDDAFSELFGTRVRSMWLATGTAANALALACIAPPFGAVLCHREAHINTDECGAPEFYSGGAKLLAVAKEYGGEGAKLDPAAIENMLAEMRGDVHQVQPAAVSITNATELGLAYRPAEVAAIGELCRKRGIRLHMDGARFANAVAATGADPADLTWRAGVDVLSFGFTKNGGMSADALLFFDEALAAQAGFRRKRGGHLLSKGRFLAAQILAMLEGDVWLRNARAANAAAARIAAAAGARLVHPVEANEIFLRLSPAEAERLRARGFQFYDWGAGEARLVTGWDQDPADVEALAAAIREL